MRHHTPVLAVAFMLSFVSAVPAVPGKALFTGAGWRAERGLHIIDMESGVRTVLTTDGVSVGKFSPDGRRIYIILSSVLYEMYNDGTSRRQVCTGVNPVYSSGTNLCITDAGAFWLEDGGAINRCIIATGATSVVATITGDYYQGLWMSSSGRRGMAWIRNNSTQHYYPFFEFPANFSTPTVKWADIWGHGHSISQDGQTVIINDWQRRCNNSGGLCTDYGDHRTFHIYNFDQINVAWTEGFVKSFKNGDPTGATGTADLHAGVNNSDYLFYDAGGCRWPPEDIGGCDTCQRAWVTNWRTEEHWQVPSLPCHNMYSNDFWYGALPPPTATNPYIALAPQSLSFMDTVLPVLSQNVTVTNTGAGTLGKVTASVSPAAPWLTVTVQGAGGNTQTITNAVDPGGLSTGAHATTVTVSGGGATNSAQYTVTLNVAVAIAAPSGLTATVGGAANRDVTLDWTDNSAGESGFVIQRRQPGPGAWVAAGSVGAGIVTWSGAGLALGTYLFRVAAFLGADTSGFSNVDTVSVIGLPSVTVTYPAAGAALAGGSVVRILWTANLVDNVEIKYSLDNEETWVTINPDGGVVRADSLWNNFPWAVPDTAVSGVIVRINQYQQESISGSSGAFSITGGSGAGGHAGVSAAVFRPYCRTAALFGTGMVLLPPGASSAKIYGLDGAVAGTVEAKNGGVIRTPGRGCWVVEMR